MPTRTITTEDGKGRLLETRTYDITQEEANEETANANLHSQAQAAINALRAYRALPSPSQAATVAVVRLLCLCVIQLIRLALRRYDDVD